MLNEDKTSRPTPELRGRGRGQFLEVEAKVEGKNNYLTRKLCYRKDDRAMRAI